MKNILNKIFQNATLMSIASYFVKFGSFIFVTPLVLEVYTPLEQSFWWLTSTVMSFAMLADSGFGSALVRAVGYFFAGAKFLPKSKAEYDQADKINNTTPNLGKLESLLSTSNVIYSVLSIIAGFLILVAVLLIWNVFEQADHRIDFWIAYALLIPYGIIIINAVKWNSFMHGLNYVAYEARFSALLSVIRIIGFSIMLLYRLPPLYLIILSTVLAFAKYIYVRYFIINWFAKRGKKLKKIFRFDKDIFSSLWPQTWRLAGIFWGNFLVEHGNSFIIAQVNNPVLMSSFLFTTRILGFVRSFSQTAFYANVPKVYKLGAQKNFKELKEKASQYMFFCLSIMISVFLLIGFLGNFTFDILDKYNILNTETRFVPGWLFLIMALTMLFDMHSSFHASVYSSTNHIPFLIPSLLSGGLIVGIGKFFALDAYGLVGIILTRFIIQLSFNNWYAMVLSLKLLNWPLREYIFEFPRIGFRFLGKKIRHIMSIVKRPRK